MKKWLLVLLIICLFVSVLSHTKNKSASSSDSESSASSKKSSSGSSSGSKSQKSSSGSSSSSDSKKSSSKKSSSESSSGSESKKSSSGSSSGSESKKSKSGSSSGSSSASSKSGSISTSCKHSSGKYFGIGEKFEEDCKLCECCITGQIVCKRIKCAAPPCGSEHYDSESECCPVCSKKCLEKQCTVPPTPCPGTSVIMFQPNKCCAECGCMFRGYKVAKGKFDRPAAAPIEDCKCKSNGVVVCQNQAPAPEVPLHCVDAAVSNETGLWHCPNGLYTCYRGSELITQADIVKVVKDRLLCKCLSGPLWHPVAICANKDHRGAIEKVLHEDMCMMMPTDSSTWTTFFTQT